MRAFAAAGIAKECGIQRTSGDRIGKRVFLQGEKKKLGKCHKFQCEIPWNPMPKTKSLRNMQPAPPQPLPHRQPKNHIHPHPTRQLQHHPNRSPQPIQQEILHMPPHLRHGIPRPFPLHKPHRRIQGRFQAEKPHLHLQVAILVAHGGAEHFPRELGFFDRGVDARVELAHGFAVGLGDGGGGELVGGAVGGEEVEGEDAGAGDVDGFGVGETSDR